MPASWSTPTTTSGGSSTRSRISRCSTTRSSTTSSATTAPPPKARPTAASTSSSSSTARPSSRRPSSWPRASTTSARPRPTTTTPSAGRTPWTRRTSGRSRSPRTGAARATARSSTGRTGIKAQGRDPHPVPPRHRRGADRARSRGAAEPTLVNGIQQTPLEGVSMAYSFDDAGSRRNDARPSTSRCSATAASTTRAGPPSPATARRGWSTEMPAFDDDVWELYAPDDWTQAHDLAAEQPEKLAELQRLFLIEARKYNVLPLDDRRVERFNPDLAGRPQLIRGNSQLLFGGMGRLTENSIARHQEQVARGHRRDRRARRRRQGRDRRPGRRLRRLEPLRRRTASRRTATTSSACSASRSTARSRCPPASTRCGWSSPTTAAASARAATSRSSSTASRSARAASTPRCRCSSPPTRPPTSASDTATPVSDDYSPQESEFTGAVRWVQIDIDEAAEDLDHLITPEERLASPWRGSRPPASHPGESGRAGDVLSPWRPTMLDVETAKGEVHGNRTRTAFGAGVQRTELPGRDPGRARPAEGERRRPRDRRDRGLQGRRRRRNGA